MTSRKTKGRSLSREHGTDVEKWDILDETLNAPQEEKLAISGEELTILVHSVKRKQPSLPNLEGKRIQKERKKERKKSVRYVGSERDEDEYAFTVNSVTSPEKIDVTAGGVVVEMLIDSGASTNVIDKNLWSKLKQDKINCVSRKSDKKLYAHGSMQWSHYTSSIFRWYYWHLFVVTRAFRSGSTSPSALPGLFYSPSTAPICVMVS